MDLEILICTHNRRPLLQRVVRSILAADLPAKFSIGLFVVANGCSDDTEDLLRSWEKDKTYFGNVAFRWQRVLELGKSVALNKSVSDIRAPVVAFVDDDHRVHHRYFYAIHEAINRFPNIALFCGRILPDWDAREPCWVHDEGPYRIYPLPVPRYEQGDVLGPLSESASTPGGGNLFMRTELIAKVGEFKTNLGPVGHNLGGAEDIEWVRRAVAQGTQIYYTPDAIQYHYVDTQRLTTRYLMKKAFERTSSTIKVMPEADNDIYGKIPIYTLRKSIVYALKAFSSLTAARRRYYLVRTAAALGEVDGFRYRAAFSKTQGST